MRKYLIVPALALGLTASAGFALAAGDNDSDMATAPHDGWMTIAQVTDKLTAEGYDVRDLKAQGDSYELFALKDGKKVESHVDPITGEVLGIDSDD